MIDKRKIMELSSIRNRDDYIKASGYVFLDMNWLNNLANYLKGKKVLEVLAGKGLLSEELAIRGVDVIATDGKYSGWFNKNKFSWKNDRVIKMEATEAIKTYGKEVDFILMSWAPYETIIAQKILLEMRNINPNCILLSIDEGIGGCIANDNFFVNAKVVYDKDFDIVQNSYVSFSYMNDKPKLYK